MQTDNIFVEHNAEVKELWRTFHAGDPLRVPMVLGISARFLLSDPALNPEGISYYDYHNDPETMLKVQLQLQDFIRHHIWVDHEMGLPQEWKIGIDGGTFHHSAWYGSEVHYSVDSPDTSPLLDDDNKNMLFDRGIPDPFSGIYGTFKNFYEYFQERLQNYSYKGRPVSPDVAVPAATAEGNGVPFTTACKIRGTTALCMDMVTDPEYAKRLLEYITEAAIARIKAWKTYLHASGPAVIYGGDHAIHEKSDFVMLGDDSVILLSPEMYREFVLPCHQRLYEELGAPDAKRGIHLCGSAGKHFRIMEKELHVSFFDSGFPFDIHEFYKDVGEHVTVQGGIHIEHLRLGSPEEITQETRDILEHLHAHKKFVFRDANHLPPATPLKNLDAMYEACKTYGRYH